MNAMRTRSLGSLSRRAFLRWFTLSAAALAAGCAAPATPTATPPPPTPTRAPDLNLWWWGEQQAPGLAAWLTGQLQAYQAQTGGKVVATLKEYQAVLSDFRQAAEAGTPPDVQSLWSGRGLFDSIWRGHLAGLDTVLPKDFLTTNAAVLSAFGGHTYRLGWYALPLTWLYNKRLFKQADLDPAAPPADWDSFIAAGRKLKAAGITPLASGLSDGYAFEAYFAYALPQVSQTLGDALALMDSDLDWTKPDYRVVWERLAQMGHEKLFADDAASTDGYTGLTRFAQSQAGMAFELYTYGRLALDALGPDVVGVWQGPRWGTGPLAARPVMDMQGFAIAARAASPQAAGDLLRFLNSQASSDALWQAARMLPASRAWDGTRLLRGLVHQQLWSDWVQANYLPYMPAIMPVDFWDKAMFQGSQKLLAGDLTPAKAAANANAVAMQWAAANVPFKQRYDQLRSELAPPRGG